MKPFARHFAVEELADNAAVRHLFARWALPGEVCDAQRCLRIGVRAGYLNLYVRGQSITRISRVGGATRLAVHPVYGSGHKRHAARPSDLDQRTVTFDSACVSAGQIDSWIEIAVTYAGAEKAFVDDLVAHNPGALDLEMALPANTAERKAPRMDLVVAQHGSLAFWEAKCSDNSELRARSAYRESSDGAYLGGIKVIHQLRKYVAWMEAGRSDRSCQVRQAYRQVASVLIGLADKFDVPGDAARAVWRELAPGAALEVILPPGLVICNYDALAQGRDAHFEKAAVANRPYLEVLRGHGVPLVERLTAGFPCWRTDWCNRSSQTIPPKPQASEG